MSENIRVIERKDEADVELEPAAFTGVIVAGGECEGQVTRRAHRLHRGMITVEYAIGIVMVLVLVGAIIASISTGTMGPFVKSFAGLIQQQLTTILQSVSAGAP